MHVCVLGSAGGSEPTRTDRDRLVGILRYMSVLLFLHMLYIYGGGSGMPLPKGISIATDACYDRGHAFRVNRFRNDGVP